MSTMTPSEVVVVVGGGELSWVLALHLNIDFLLL